MIGKKGRRSEVAQVPGNTKAGTCLRARAFQLTLNEPEKYQEVENYFMGLKNLGYWIACKETAPLTGHEHIHIYAHFEESQKISIKKCQGAHIEICRGSPKQNIEYIKKDGNIIKEWGTEPHQGMMVSIKDALNMEKEERQELPLVYYNIVKQIEEKQSNKMYIDELYKEVKVYYIWGESGVGKTCKAKEIVKEWFKENMPDEKPFCNMLKCTDGFWHGVGEERIAAIYDDWRDSHMKPSEFIHFIDYNKQRMNIKGGGLSNDYKLIVITSVQDFKKIYSGMQDEEPRRQWERRVQVIHLEKLKEKDDSNKVLI